MKRLRIFLKLIRAAWGISARSAAGLCICPDSCRHEAASEWKPAPEETHAFVADAFHRRNDLATGPFLRHEEASEEERSKKGRGYRGSYDKEWYAGLCGPCARNEVCLRQALRLSRGEHV